MTQSNGPNNSANGCIPLLFFLGILSLAVTYCSGSFEKHADENTVSELVCFNGTNSRIGMNREVTWYYLTGQTFDPAEKQLKKPITLSVSLVELNTIQASGVVSQEFDSTAMQVTYTGSGDSLTMRSTAPTNHKCPGRK